MDQLYQALKHIRYQMAINDSTCPKKPHVSREAAEMIEAALMRDLCDISLRCRSQELSASLIEALGAKEGHWRLTDEAAEVLLQGSARDAAAPGQSLDCPVASRVALQQVDSLLHIARWKSSGHG